MGRSGVSYHIRKPHEPLATAGIACAVFGENRRWTSFAPLGNPPDAAALVDALDGDLVIITAHDDFGASVAFYSPDGWSAELGVPNEDDGQLSLADRALFARAVKRGILTSARRAKLEQGLRADRRFRWIEEGGVEDAFGLPLADPPPSPLTAELIREIDLESTIVRPPARAKAKANAKPKTKSKTKPKAEAKPKASSRAAVDPRVLALHVHYWTELFQMNCWKLYNRYKKHLPAERRREVDQLVNSVVLGTSEPIASTVANILSTVWHDDDWLAAIRDPELAKWEPLSREQLADWQRRLDVAL